MRLSITLLLPLALLLGQTGVAQNFDPYTPLEAETYTTSFGVQPGASPGAVGYLENGDYLGFAGVTFGTGELYNGVVRAASDTDGGTIEFRLGSFVGPLLATAEITGTGGWTTFEKLEIELAPDYAFGNATVPEQTDLYLVFTGGGGFLFDVDWFSFSDTVVTATGLTITNCPEEPILVGEVYDFDAELTPVNTTNDFTAWYASDGVSVDYISGEFLTQTAGSYTVSTTSFSNGSVSDECAFEVTDGGQAAFNGPHTIPGTIEAEFYDTGGTGVAYRDDDRKQGLLSFRPEDFVDVGAKSNASNGLAVGWTEDGEFLEYTLDSVTQGRYDVTLTYSAGGGAPGAVDLLIDSEARLRFNGMEPTGSWNTFATTTERDVFIRRGSVLRLLYRGADFDLDKIAFVPVTSSLRPAAVADAPAPGVRIFPNPSSDGRFNVTLDREERIRISDLHGRLIRERHLPAGRSSVDLGRQPAGVYFLRTGGGVYRLIRR